MVPTARTLISARSRLVDSPVFILCSIRSGSTLLRSILNRHCDLHAPHELHLTDLALEYSHRHAKLAMTLLKHEREDLEHLLWDRILHLELIRSGKRQIVEKTPGNLFSLDRIGRCWPNARYVFLTRHPMSIAESVYRAGEYESLEAAIDLVRPYLVRLRSAMDGLPGHVISYEQLTLNPAASLKALCDYLEVAWVPSILHYGVQELPTYLYGVGDYSEKIRSGRIQRAEPLPDQISPSLKSLCGALGYQ